VPAVAGASIFIAQADGIADPRLRGLFDYWTTRRAPPALPARADFDVLDLKPWLGNLMLVDVIEGGREFRYRLYGSTLAHYYGKDMTGRTTDEVRAEAREWVREEYRAVVAERRPMIVRRDREVRHRIASVSKLVLPLAGDGITVDMLLVGAYPSD
jgi:hypothetical protein